MADVPPNISGPASGIVQRAKDILLKPKETWPVIAAEPATTQSIYVPYVVVLAAIGPIESVKVDWQTKVLPDWGPDTIVGIARIDSAQRICDGGRIPGLSAPPSNNSKQSRQKHTFTYICLP